jgi:predicted cupin superfamily sugar epimerase
VPITKDAEYWIEKLRLQPHPEGGYYRETYRAALVVAKTALPRAFSGSRAVATAIYYLLEGDNFSAFHRLCADEIWHFYAGGTLVVSVIDARGEYSEILLGSDAEAGEMFQAVVKAGCWFAARVKYPNSFALIGCTLSPGFEFDDFELGKRAELVRLYPRYREMIEKLTRG